MRAAIILGFTIVAGAVVGLAILQLAHEVIIRRIYSGPEIDNESMPAPGSLLNAAASRQSAVN